MNALLIHPAFPPTFWSYKYAIPFIFILNEAELTLPPLIEDLQAGCPKRVYASREFPSLSATPLPMWGLIDLKRYATMSIQIYSPRYYYQRVVTFLREFKTTGVETPMDLQRFLAFFRSCLRLGIIGRERAQYWKLMVWTLLRRPRLFSLAMTLAIQGYHFRKVSELHLLNTPGKRRGCHA